jgi:hypothetical protein
MHVPFAQPHRRFTFKRERSGEVYGRGNVALFTCLELLSGIVKVIENRGQNMTELTIPANRMVADAAAARITGHTDCSGHQLLGLNVLAKTELKSMVICSAVRLTY